MEEGQGLKPGYENSVISQPVCLGLTNLVATCVKTRILGHITQYLFSDFFPPKYLSLLVNANGIRRKPRKAKLWEKSKL